MIKIIGVQKNKKLPSILIKGVIFGANKHSAGNDRTFTEGFNARKSPKKYDGFVWALIC